MAYFVCIAIGQDDFMPDSQDYIAASSKRELCAMIASACRIFDAEEREARPRAHIYRYKFRAPSSPSVNNWTQRLRISGADNRVLDVIGMTQSEFYREGEGA